MAYPGLDAVEEAASSAFVRNSGTPISLSYSWRKEWKPMRARQERENITYCNSVGNELLSKASWWIPAGNKMPIWSPHEEARPSLCSIYLKQTTKEINKKQKSKILYWCLTTRADTTERDQTPRMLNSILHIGPNAIFRSIASLKSSNRNWRQAALSWPGPISCKQEHIKKKSTLSTPHLHISPLLAQLDQAKQIDGEEQSKKK